MAAPLLSFPSTPPPPLLFIFLTRANIQRTRSAFRALAVMRWQWFSANSLRHSNSRGLLFHWTAVITETIRLPAENMLARCRKCDSATTSHAVAMSAAYNYVRNARAESATFRGIWASDREHGVAWPLITWLHDRSLGTRVFWHDQYTVVRLSGSFHNEPPDFWSRDYTRAYMARKFLRPTQRYSPLFTPSASPSALAPPPCQHSSSSTSRRTQKE